MLLYKESSLSKSSEELEVKLLPWLEMLDMEFCRLDKDVDTEETEEEGIKEADDETTSTQE